MNIWTLEIKALPHCEFVIKKKDDGEIIFCNLPAEFKVKDKAYVDNNWVFLCVTHCNDFYNGIKFMNGANK